MEKIINWFKIYKGVVEDNNDPSKMGRVRIRILGIHTHKKEASDSSGIPSNELPWCNPAHPIFSSSVTGVGVWKPPVNGTWVYCFPEDELLQRWVYFASLSGFPQEKANSDLGFNDPNGEYPLEDRIEEPDMNRLAANREIDKTIVDIKIKEKVKNIKVASLMIVGSSVNSFKKPHDLDKKYDEPQEPYATEYPHNMVFESEPGKYKSGHIIEIDDTPDKERITVWHKTGTFVSIHWNGQKIEKTVNDRFEINLKNRYEYTNYDKIETVWGDSRSLVRSNRQIETYGWKKEYVKGSETQYVSGDVGVWIGAEMPSNPTKAEIITENKLKEGSSPEPPEKTVPNENSIGGNRNYTIENNDILQTKGNSHNTIDGTYYIEVTGSRTHTKNKVGDPGSYTIEPHSTYLVRGHSMCKIRGVSQFLDFGCVSQFSICPFIINQHLMPSFSVKVTS